MLNTSMLHVWWQLSCLDSSRLVLLDYIFLLWWPCGRVMPVGVLVGERLGPCVGQAQAPLHEDIPARRGGSAGGEDTQSQPEPQQPDHITEK